MSKTTRVQLDFKAETVDRLDYLVVATESPSRASLLKNALKVYAMLYEEQKKGNSLCIKTADGSSTRELLLIM